MTEVIARQPKKTGYIEQQLKNFKKNKSIVFFVSWWYNSQNSVVLCITIVLGGMTHGRE